MRRSVKLRILVWLTRITSGAAPFCSVAMLVALFWSHDRALGLGIATAVACLISGAGAIAIGVLKDRIWAHGDEIQMHAGRRKKG